jgi:hypothetical protein
MVVRHGCLMSVVFHSIEYDPKPIHPDRLLERVIVQKAGSRDVPERDFSKTMQKP